jgi:putative transposase
MPRASRHFLPGHVWHITHRCHQKAFLLKFAQDRQHYLHWLFEAKKRFGLGVLNYTVTSNHIHILVKDTAPEVIARSMQLIAGRTAQDYNQRKARKGAFWEDRYHATAIEGGEHLHRCLVYIDLNMVRAGVVKHPAEWVHSGYREIQAPPERYGIIDLVTLSALTGFSNVAGFQRAHREWVEEALSAKIGARDERWSEALAVGSREYVDRVKAELGIRAAHRQVAEIGGACALREPGIPYAHGFEGKNDVLKPENSFSWNEVAETTGG